MEKPVYCPNCNRKVATYDGKSLLDIETACNKCKRLIIYEPLSRKTISKPLPGRTTSSGCRFY